MRRFNTGQSTLEYAVIITVVVAALLAIQIYIKRSVQGKLRESTDQIGEQFFANNTTIYENTSRTGTTVQEISAGVTTSYSGASGQGSPETRTVSGSETVKGW